MRHHPTAIAKTCQTAGCGVVFLGVPQRHYCSACQRASKKASDGRSSARQRAHEQRDHLTEAQVEEVFQQALAQIRRERRFTSDERSSHAWKYTEPGR